METRASTEQGRGEENKKNEGEKLLDTPGAWTKGPRVPGHEDLGRSEHPGHPGCPASAWAAPKPAPGARAHGPGCPTHLLGLAQPAPGAPLIGPGCPTLAHQPLGATPGAQPAPDLAGCPAPSPPGARSRSSVGL